VAHRFAQWFIRLIVRLVARVEVFGMEKANISEGIIVASNHLGRLDAVLIYNFLDRQDVVMMVAEKYRKYALIRWFVKALNAMWVDRFNADLGAMRAALGVLKKKGVLVMAPEGTRSRSEVLIQGRAGASYLASKTGAWVIPVGVAGTEDKKVVAQLKKLRRARITVKVGDPFKLPPVKGEDREEQLQQNTDEIMCRIALLLPPSYWGFYTDHPRLKELLTQQAEMISKGSLNVPA
jgi:1-acyl-sn-glycerol-3-phosphate acyltransferase